MKRDAPPLWAGFVFLVPGLALLTGCVLSIAASRDKLATWAEAPGRVVALEERSDSDGSSYAPEVEFTTEDGEAIRFVDSLGSNPPSYEPGDDVRVLYPNGNPRDATIRSFGSLWFVAIVTGVLGASFAAGGGLLVTVAVRARRRR